MGSPLSQRLWFGLWIALIGAVLSACGGGGGSSGGGGNSGGAGGSGSIPAISATPSATPLADTTLAPASQTTSVLLPTSTSSTSAPLQVALPALPDVSSQIAFPVSYADPGTTIAIANGTVPPAGVPLLQSRERRLEDTLGILGLVYISFTPSGSMTMGFPGVTFTLGPSAQIDPSDQFYLALYDSSQPALGYIPGVAGPVSAVNGVVTIPAGTGVSNWQRGVQYVLALYRVRRGHTPPPKPTPSPTPSAGAFTLTPSSLSFLGTGLTQTFTVSESNYAGPFTATSGTPSVASIASVDQLGRTWSVTSLSAGTSIITIKDATGRTTTLTVTVTVTIIPLH